MPFFFYYHHASFTSSKLFHINLCTICLILLTVNNKSLFVAATPTVTTKKVAPTGKKKVLIYFVSNELVCHIFC